MLLRMLGGIMVHLSSSLTAFSKSFQQLPIHVRLCTGAHPVTSHGFRTFWLLTTSLKRVVLMKIYLKCRYLVMYFWKNIKSHNKIQRNMFSTVASIFSSTLEEPPECGQYLECVEDNAWRHRYCPGRWKKFQVFYGWFVLLDKPVEGRFSRFCVVPCLLGSTHKIASMVWKCWLFTGLRFRIVNCRSSPSSMKNDPNKNQSKISIPVCHVTILIYCMHVLLEHGKIWQKLTLNWNMSSGESCKKGNSRPHYMQLFNPWEVPSVLAPIWIFIELCLQIGWYASGFQS